MKNKKGEFGNMGLTVLAGVAVALLIVVIVLSLAGDTLSDFRTDQVAGTCAEGVPLDCTTAYNITSLGIDATENVSERLPIIGTVVGVAVLIGIIVSAFRFRS